MKRVLDLRRRDECAWDIDMRPIGEGEINKESFTEWWRRFGPRLAHLDPRIAEQWIHRHWANSYMAFLNLELLTWRVEVWPSERILSEVHMEFGGPMDADHDYIAFNGRYGFGPNATAKAMNEGTWDIPLLVLATPTGIRSFDGDLPDVRYVVAEGSKRMRYLHALQRRGQGCGPHELIILNTPQAA
jgi:hypothetical protein